jgi:hypothetical protein
VTGADEAGSDLPGSDAAGVEATNRVVELFAADFSVYGDFLSDFSCSADVFDVEVADGTVFSSSSSDNGQALRQYVCALQRRDPSWARIDADQVDWPHVSDALERRLLQLVGFGH